MYLPDNREYIPVPAPNLSMEKTPAATQSLDERVCNFEEVSTGYTPEEAIQEASRCLNCPRSYCVDFCPAHVPVSQFIAAVREGDFEGAYRLIRQKNTMPGATGRICAQECQCESHCTRGIKGEPVAIGRLEAFVADWHRKHAAPESSPAVSSAPKVAVVGSGPAGLACAEKLAASGIGVDVFEAGDRLGGAASTGIPTFVLPPAVLEDKLSELRRMGIQFHTQTEIHTAESLLGAGFDAVFLGTGATRPVSGDIPGTDLTGVYTADEFFSALRSGKEIPSVASAFVIGGGNTAIDAARSARRMGIREVTILYRRSLAEMPARQEEVRRAQEEGILIRPLCQPTEFLGDQGQLNGIRCIGMELTEADYPLGRRAVRPLSGTETVLSGQLAILALGYEVDDKIPVARKADGRIQVSDADQVSTSVKRVFAAGDAVTGPATFVAALAGGQRAAEAILRLLSDRES